MLCAGNYLRSFKAIFVIVALSKQNLEAFIIATSDPKKILTREVALPEPQLTILTTEEICEPMVRP